MAKRGKTTGVESGTRTYAGEAAQGPAYVPMTKKAETKLVATAIAAAVALTPTTIDGRKLYKVLSPEGTSQNGGTLKWSLPSGDQPGDWHETSRALMCHEGLHLTVEPLAWHKERCRVFEVEALELATDHAGAVLREEDKVVARRVRLLRELSDDELVSINIFRTGKHDLREGRGVAEGSAQVTASGSAQVTASGSAQVTAYDSAQVTAYNRAQVTAYDSAQVTAYDSAQVTASGESLVSTRKTYWNEAKVTLTEAACHVDFRSGTAVFTTSKVGS